MRAYLHPSPISVDYRVIRNRRRLTDRIGDRAYTKLHVPYVKLVVLPLVSHALEWPAPSVCQCCGVAEWVRHHQQIAIGVIGKRGCRPFGALES